MLPDYKLYTLLTSYTLSFQYTPEMFMYASKMSSLTAVTYGLFDGIVHNNAQRLVDTAHQSGDVPAMELVRPHHFTGVALRPVDVVLEDGHSVWVLENLVWGA